MRDVGAGTLAVYANGRRLGTLVQPGMTNSYTGEPVAPLRPPLRWAVQLSNGAEVAIDGPQPVPGSTEFESTQQALQEAVEKAQEEAKKEVERIHKQEYDLATSGSSHNDQALRKGTIVWVGGISGRGTYKGFHKKAFGANEHTIKFDDGSGQTLKLKEQRWKYLR